MIRKRFAGFAASALALAVTAQAFAGTVTTDGADIVVKTKGGLEVATTDQNFSFKLGGRLQADYGTFDGFYTKNGDSADAAYFRRAYIEFGGTVYKDWKYQVNYDLSHNSGNADDGYFDEASLSYTGFKPVVIRAGRFDEDFGLEKATSSKWVTGIDRNAAYEVADWIHSHANGMGIQASSVVGDMAYLSASVSSKDINDKNGKGVKQFNARAVFAPMHDTGNVLHLGLDYAVRDLKDTAFDSRIRPRLGVRGVSTNGGNDAGANGNRATFGGFFQAKVFGEGAGPGARRPPPPLREPRRGLRAADWDGESGGGWRRARAPSPGPGSPPGLGGARHRGAKHRRRLITSWG